MSEAISGHLRFASRAFLLAVLLAAPLMRAGDERAPRPAPASDVQSSASRLDGVWLVDAANRGDGVSWLNAAWSSPVTLAGGVFTIPHFRGTPRDLNGTSSLDPSGRGTIDLKVDAFVLSAERKWIYPACTLPGLYKIDGSQLTICFPVGPDPQRPVELKAADNKQILLRLVRAGAGFKTFPTDVTVTVLDPAGKPAAGVEVCASVSHLDPVHPKAKPGWTYSPHRGQTGADGTATLRYADLANNQMMAHDADRKLTGIASVSPASLRNGTVTVHLAPERLVTGTITCAGENNAGKVPKWTNVYLLLAGQRIGMCDSFSGQFGFPLPPGSYTLQVYGTQMSSEFVPLTVPPGEGEIRVPPIALSPIQFVDGAGRTREAVKQGHAAVELEGVAGWKGAPVRLADLRGKVVLLNFWGVWCGPCVAEMPVLIELHQRYKDKGLVVVGVHVDQDGQLDTAAKLDAAIATISKEYWDGKDLPFSVALVSGKIARARKSPAQQYGVFGYPTTIVIDRKGNIVGELGGFGPKDIDKAAAAAEKLLRED